MLSKNDIKDIINDIVGTIALIVEDESYFKVNINNFFINNFDLFTKGNLIDTTLEECKSKIDLSLVISNLIIDNFDVFDIFSEENLSNKDINIKHYINRDLVIKLK